MASSARRARAAAASRPSSRKLQSSSGVDLLLVCLVAGASYLVCSYGLFTTAPQVQVGIVAGAIAGLLGKDRVRHSAAIGATVFAVALLFPSWNVDPTLGAAQRISAAALAGTLSLTIAALVQTLLQTSDRRATVERIVMAIVLGLIVVNLWSTSLQLDRLPLHGAPLLESLDQVPQPGAYQTDDQLYLRVFYLMHAGTDFYTAFGDASRGVSTWNDLPVQITGYRLPPVFWLWQLLPERGSALVTSFLVVATVGVVAAFFVSAAVVRPPLGLLGALSVGVYFLQQATSTYVLFVDGWAVAIGLVAVAAYLWTLKSKSRGLLVLPPLIALAAACSREILGYLLIAGALSTIVLPRRERLRAAAPWLAALAAFALVYAAHATAVAGRISSRSSFSRILSGSPRQIAEVLQFAVDYFNARPWSVVALVALGAFGGLAVLLRRDRSAGVFLLFATLAPYAALLVFGTYDVATGEPLGYWGMLTVPISLACSPLASLWLEPKTERQAARVARTPIG